MAGVFRRIRPSVREIGSVDTAHRIAKVPHWRAFLSLSRLVSPTPGLAGWRRRDRTHAFLIEPVSTRKTFKTGILAISFIPNVGGDQPIYLARTATWQSEGIPDDLAPKFYPVLSSPLPLVEVLPKSRPGGPGISGVLAHAVGNADEPFNSDIGALLPIALCGRTSL